MQIARNIIIRNPAVDHVTLARLLKKAAISQRSLARECEVSAATVNLFVKSGILPRSPQLRAKLHDDITQILTGAGCLPSDINKALNQEEPPMGLTPQALKHFGFPNNPFSAARVNGPRDVLEVFEHTNAVDRICDAGTYGEFLILVGPQGTGKTIAVDAAEYHLKHERSNSCRVVRILQPDTETIRISHIINSVSRGIGCLYNGWDQNRKIENILDIVRSKNAARILIVIDDGHALHPRTLVAIKRLWDNTKSDFMHMLGIVILAQPHIKPVLARTDLEEVRTQADIVEIWGLMNETEIREYIDLKLSKYDGIGLLEIDTHTKIWNYEQKSTDEHSVMPIEPRHLNQVMIDLLNRAALLGDAKITEAHVSYVYTNRA